MGPRASADFARVFEPEASCSLTSLARELLSLNSRPNPALIL